MSAKPELRLRVNLVRVQKPTSIFLVDQALRKQSAQSCLELCSVCEVRLCRRGKWSLRRRGAEGHSLPWDAALFCRWSCRR